MSGRRLVTIVTNLLYIVNISDVNREASRPPAPECGRGSGCGEWAWSVRT